MGNVATKLQGCFGEKTFIEKEHTDNYTKHVEYCKEKHSFSGKLVVEDFEKLCEDINRVEVRELLNRNFVDLPTSALPAFKTQARHVEKVTQAKTKIREEQRTAEVFVQVVQTVMGDGQRGRGRRGKNRGQGNGRRQNRGGGQVPGGRGKSQSRERGEYAPRQRGNKEGNKEGKSKDKCYSCGERGHWARECPNSENSRLARIQQ